MSSRDDSAHEETARRPDDPEHAREEYTAYRETDPDALVVDPDAVREADLQPGTPLAERGDDEDVAPEPRDPD